MALEEMFESAIRIESGQTCVRIVGWMRAKAGVDFNDEQRMQPAKSHRVSAEEIAGQNSAGLA
jgi:hypothetical protein